MTRLCTYPGCSGDHHANGYCRKHNARISRTGDPGIVRDTKQPRSSRGSATDIKVGATYGRWKVVAAHTRRGSNNTAYFPCECSCGTERYVPLKTLRQAARGTVDGSCGCVQREVMASRRTLPGEPGSPEYQKARWLRTTYKLEWPDYLKMLADQGNACLICLCELTVVHVDHDHACCPGERSCGKCIRGLLCPGCNHGIGNFNDDPGRMERAARYVRGAL